MYDEQTETNGKTNSWNLYSPVCDGAFYNCAYFMEFDHFSERAWIGF